MPTSVFPVLTTSAQLFESTESATVVCRPELILVAPSAELQSQARRADRVMVDLEQTHKQDRQAGYDTQINTQRPGDVLAAVARQTAPVLARINPLHAETHAELREVFACGADSVMLPMATHSDQIQRFLEMVASTTQQRKGVIVQVETLALFKQAEPLARLAQSLDASAPYALRFYVGFNDLMIQRGDCFLWQPLLDGSLARFFAHFPPFTVGFGGLTHPQFGEPIPSIELIAEMTHLKCAMTVLRRSFVRDVAGHRADEAISEIHAAFAKFVSEQRHMQEHRDRLQHRLQTLWDAIA